MGKTKKAKKTADEKFQEEYPEFVGEVVGLSVDQLNSRLAEQAKAAEWNETTKEEDEELEEAQKAASELAAPYRDAKKAIRAKSKYLIKLIKEKGGT
ncbi:unnamed protein product [Sphagnum balticum]